MAVTCVDGRVCCNFHGMVQCYAQMLHIVVMLCSNFFAPWKFVMKNTCYTMQFATVLTLNTYTVLIFTICKIPSHEKLLLILVFIFLKHAPKISAILHVLTNF